MKKFKNSRLSTDSRKLQTLALKSYKGRNSISSSHPSLYPSSKASRVFLRDAILTGESGRESRKIASSKRRQQVCLVLFFPPKDVDLDPGCGALGGRPPGRRRELLKVSTVLRYYMKYLSLLSKLPLLACRSGYEKTGQLSVPHGKISQDKSYYYNFF